MVGKAISDCHRRQLIQQQQQPKKLTTHPSSPKTQLEQKKGYESDTQRLRPIPTKRLPPPVPRMWHTSFRRGTFGRVGIYLCERCGNIRIDDAEDRARGEV